MTPAGSSGRYCLALPLVRSIVGAARQRRGRRGGIGRRCLRSARPVGSSSVPLKVGNTSRQRQLLVFPNPLDRWVRSAPANCLHRRKSPWRGWAASRRGNGACSGRPDRVSLGRTPARRIAGFGHPLRRLDTTAYTRPRRSAKSLVGSTDNPACGDRPGMTMAPEAVGLPAG